MIDIRGGELINLITQPFDDVDMRCFSYAVKQITGYILEFADRIRTNAFIDGLPGYILDVLAQELRAPYYRQDLDEEAKRNIIKGSLKWNYTAGTASAVTELTEAVFGRGEVVEWFDFETEDERIPGLFDVSTNMPMSLSSYNLINNMIGRVKNERSHLRQIKIVRTAEPVVYAGVSTEQSSRIVIRCANTAEIDMKADLSAGIMTGYDANITILKQEE